jgi:hypothetical protein
MTTTSSFFRIPADISSPASFFDLPFLLEGEGGRGVGFALGRADRSTTAAMAAVFALFIAALVFALLIAALVFALLIAALSLQYRWKAATCAAWVDPGSPPTMGTPPNHPGSG